MKRLHYTNKRFERLINRRKTNLRPDDKPQGLWYSVGNAWVDWCVGETFDGLGRWQYELEVDFSKMLVLSTIKAIRDFTKEYGVKERYEAGFKSGPFKLDWPKIKKLYSGVEINPYQWKLRHDKRFRWYYSWDVASDCIWKSNALIGWKESEYVEQKHLYKVS